MDKKEFALKKHEEWAGKIEVIARSKVGTPEDLSVAYTPGVAEPCLKIAENVDLSYVYTRRHNMVAVVTDGTAVLGLGDIGPEAGMPVMEGKCVLFKEFGGVDAFPLCIRSKDVDEIVRTVELLAGREVELPRYNFKTGKREYKGDKLQLGEHDVLVIEGIHCLNDALTPYLAKENKFKIYITL